MITLIRYFDARLRGGIVLSVRGNAIRVAMPLCGDCAEFTARHGQWYSETTEPVDIQFCATDIDEDAPDRYGATRGERFGMDRFCPTLTA